MSKFTHVLCWLKIVTYWYAKGGGGFFPPFVFVICLKSKRYKNKRCSKHKVTYWSDYVSLWQVSRKVSFFVSFSHDYDLFVFCFELTESLQWFWVQILLLLYITLLLNSVWSRLPKWLSTEEDQRKLIQT